ncbi:MAG: sialate O-acetylesterase [Paludibacter sp.]
MKKNVLTILFLAFVLVGKLSAAGVKPNSLFSDNAVFQRAVEVPIWGTADNGEKITVEFNGQKVETVAENGKWMLKLKAMKENSIPQNLVITGKNVITLKNILVGEVWLCSGQSNMGFPLRSVRALGDYPKVAEVLKDAQNYPLVHQFSVPLKKSTDIPAVVDDVNGKWNVCDSKNAENFSAVAFFFGRDLFKKLNVPIGLINSSYGGTACENWMSKETLESFPELKSIMENYNKAIKEFPAKLQGFQLNQASLAEQFTKDSTVAVLQGKALPKKPTAPMSPAERGGPTGLWNTMISPLIPYAIKGAVWYQGEANASRGLQYRTLLPALINNWRTAWKQGDFPFLIVQIPGWKNHFPELKEAQLLTWQKVPKTSMTVTYDLDDTLDVHPGNKQPVGERLVLAARAVAYGEKIEYSGPVYQSMKVDGNKIILTFTHVGTGLVAKCAELKDFTIAGDDKVFVPAKAEIVKDKVIVTAEGVDNPVAVRAGWRLCPQMNLYNNENLPATPFRTDLQ